MIKFHGSPISGSADQAARFYKNRHVLVSFYEPRHLPVILEQCDEFVLDSGTFSTWRAGGGKINFEAYTSFCFDLYRHPRFRWALMPDIIEGSVTENDDLIAGWPREIPGVPVFHLHEPLTRLDYLVSHYPIVALGSSGQWRTPGTKDWWERMHLVMAVGCDRMGRPRAKFHGLRMLNTKIFTRLPLSYADSANVAINTGSLKRFGSYDPPSASVRASMIADRIESCQSVAIWEPWL